MDFWGYSYCVITGGLWRLLRSLEIILGITGRYERSLELLGITGDY